MRLKYLGIGATFGGFAFLGAYRKQAYPIAVRQPLKPVLNKLFRYFERKLGGILAFCEVHKPHIPERTRANARTAADALVVNHFGYSAALRYRPEAACTNAKPAIILTGAKASGNAAAPKAGFARHSIDKTIIHLVRHIK